MRALAPHSRGVRLDRLEGKRLLKCSVSVLLFLLRLFPYLLLFAFCTRDPLCIRLLRNFLLRSFFHLRSTCLSIYSVLYLVLMLSQSLV